LTNITFRGICIVVVEQHSNDAANKTIDVKPTMKWLSILPTQVGVSAVLIVMKSSSARCRSHRA
jgi:hypothetical protein